MFSEFIWASTWAIACLEGWNFGQQDVDLDKLQLKGKGIVHPLPRRRLYVRLIWTPKHHQFKIMLFMIQYFFRAFFFWATSMTITSHPLVALSTVPAGWWKWRPVWASQAWKIQIAVRIRWCHIYVYNRYIYIYIHYTPSCLLTDLQTCHVERSLCKSFLGYTEASSWCRILGHQQVVVPKKWHFYTDIRFTWTSWIILAKNLNSLIRH